MDIEQLLVVLAVGAVVVALVVCLEIIPHAAAGRQRRARANHKAAIAAHLAGCPEDGDTFYSSSTFAIRERPAVCATPRAAHVRAKLFEEQLAMYTPPPPPAQPKVTLMTGMSDLAIAYAIGAAGLPYRNPEGCTGARRSPTPLLLVGPHGYRKEVTRDYTERPEDALPDIILHYRNHLRYHDTLDRMVKERIEKEDNDGPVS